METIADNIAAVEAEHEAAPPGEERPVIPLSGKTIEPSRSVRDIAALTGDPFDVTIIAAPRITGQADRVLVRRSWEPIARELADLGRKRRGLSLGRWEAGAESLKPVEEKIQQAWQVAAGLGMPVQTIADLLGITRQTVYDIIQGRTRSGIPPVQLPHSTYETSAKKRPWTDAEIRVLQRPDLTDGECAAQLDRPIRGVTMKRRWLARQEAQGE